MKNKSLNNTLFKILYLNAQSRQWNHAWKKYLGLLFIQFYINMMNIESFHNFLKTSLNDTLIQERCKWRCVGSFITVHPTVSFADNICSHSKTKHWAQSSH